MDVKRLIKKYDAGKYGIWQIWGEDRNLDLCGPRDIPLLATIEGVYKDVLDYALEQPGFVNWGSGGDIQFLEVFKLHESLPHCD